MEYLPNKGPHVWQVRLYTPEKTAKTFGKVKNVAVLANRTNEVVRLLEKEMPEYSMTGISDQGAVTYIDTSEDKCPQKHYRVGYRKSYGGGGYYNEHCGVLANSVGQAAIRVQKDFPQSEIMSVSFAGEIQYVIDLPPDQIPS